MATLPTPTHLWTQFGVVLGMEQRSWTMAWLCPDPIGHPSLRSLEQYQCPDTSPNPQHSNLVVVAVAVGTNSTCCSYCHCKRRAERGVSHLRWVKCSPAKLAPQACLVLSRTPKQDSSVQTPDLAPGEFAVLICRLKLPVLLLLLTCRQILPWALKDGPSRLAFPTPKLPCGSPFQEEF